jgi:GTP-binding protein Era
MPELPSFRCGSVAIVGRPNVGKSTLFNRIVGQKISITAPKPQTTRHRILGLKTTVSHQIICLDTPGMHAGRQGALQRYLNQAAEGAMAEADAVLLVVEALHWTAEDASIQAKLAEAGGRAPVFLAVNKIDQLRDKNALLPYLQQIAEGGIYTEIVPVSARRGENLQHLEELLVRVLPTGEAIFPEDQITDRSTRFLTAELVREQLTLRLGQELPYRLSVTIEEYLEEDRLVRIAAVIWVEQPGQKAIVIGKQGQVLKVVGSAARRGMESLLGKKVFLQLWVRVKEGWTNNERLLQRMGYVD